ncbi:MAG: flippase-like domain-containing protein, partial [Bacteroidia bacterium]|nr:flippase-like domain-containing protein [Bacteroidia bacterium]
MAGKTARSLIQFFVLLAIGILLIWLSLRQVAPQKDKIADAFTNANYFWIGVAMFVALLSHFLRAYRWNYLLEPLGHKVNLLNATCHVLVGYFANYGIPRMGEISRCTLASKYDKVPFEIGFGTVITERIVDFMLLLVIFALTLAFQFAELIDLANQYIFDKLREKFSDIGENPVKLIVVCGVIVLAILGFLFLRKKFSGLLKGKLGGIIKGMGEGIASIRKLERPGMFVLLSVLIWA